MDRKKFFKPSRKKIILTIALFIIIFLVPYFKIHGEIFQGGFIRTPLILVVATFVAFIINDFLFVNTFFEIIIYLLALIFLIFITYSLACFINLKLKFKK